MSKTISNEDNCTICRIVLPGDEVTHLLEDMTKSNNAPKILGPGLRRVADKVLACNAGILKKKGQSVFWVDCHKKRYVPVKNEQVVGLVVNKSGDTFKVDIGSNEQANLSYLSFEGANKKNRPRVDIGEVIYARLLEANRDMEPELVCVNSSLKKDDMGILPEDGFVFGCSLNVAKKLQTKYAPVFDKLGKQIPYEIAIGANGRVWIHSQCVRNTIAIANVILASEFKKYQQVQQLCNELIDQHFLIAT